MSIDPLMASEKADARALGRFFAMCALTDDDVTKADNLSAAMLEYGANRLGYRYGPGRGYDVFLVAMRYGKFVTTSVMRRYPE